MNTTWIDVVIVLSLEGPTGKTLRRFKKDFEMPAIPAVGTKLTLYGLDRAHSAAPFSVVVHETSWNEQKSARWTIYATVDDSLDKGVGYLGGLDEAMKKLHSAGWSEVIGRV